VTPFLDKDSSGLRSIWIVPASAYTASVASDLATWTLQKSAFGYCSDPVEFRRPPPTSVSGSKEIQCLNRRHNVLDLSIGGATRRAGKWTALEESKLKDAVQYKRTVTRIGSQFQRWFLVERKKVFEQMARCLESQHRPDGGT
jgi:hypothetical protein